MRRPPPVYDCSYFLTLEQSPWCTEPKPFAHELDHAPLLGPDPIRTRGLSDPVDHVITVKFKWPSVGDL